MYHREKDKTLQGTKAGSFLKSMHCKTNPAPSTPRAASDSREEQAAKYTL